MDREEAKVRGAALRAYIRTKLPIADARSITALARKAGLRPNTVAAWWTEGSTPDNDSLRALGGVLGVELSELVAAYEGSSGRTWVLTDPELAALVERAAETAVRRVLAERERTPDE
jgi:transcriptional regulator with XRE-family HTH domain